MYGLGAFLSPVIYSWLTLNMINGESFFPINILLYITPNGFEWTSAYFLFILLLLSLIVIVVLLHFPQHEEEISSTQNGKDAYKELLRNKDACYHVIGA